MTQTTEPLNSLDSVLILELSGISLSVVLKLQTVSSWIPGVPLLASDLRS